MEHKDYNPKVIWAICFILLFSVMNVTMFNIAIPSIAEQFALLHSEVSWVTTGYAIIYALGSLTYGKLADRFPLKRLITIGIVMFCVGSIVGFFASSYSMLLVGRFIQSAGASSIPALAMLIPARLVPQAQRGKALGTIASTIAFASGIGPIVGGFITGAASWNVLFLISLGTLLTVPLFLRWLPKEETRTGTFDVPGAALLGGGVVACLVITFLSGTAAFGIMIVIPTLLSDVNGLTPVHIGFTLFPAAMSAALLGRYGGKLADRRGNGFVVTLAQGLILTGLLLLSSVSGYGPWLISVSMAFVSIGFSFMQASITNHVSSLLPRGMTGIGMGTFTLVNFLSGSVSGAVMMKALDESAGAAAVNPFAPDAASGFSNVFLIMSVLIVINLFLVSRTFRDRGEGRSPAIQS